MQSVEELVKGLTFKEVKELLVDMAIHFSDKTEILVAPVGTREWVVEVCPEDNSNSQKTIHIPLIHFFGMYVGYNSELDLLVMWKL